MSRRLTACIRATDGSAKAVASRLLSPDGQSAQTGSGLDACSARGTDMVGRRDEEDGDRGTGTRDGEKQRDKTWPSRAAVETRQPGPPFPDGQIASDGRWDRRLGVCREACAYTCLCEHLSQGKGEAQMSMQPAYASLIFPFPRPCSATKLSRRGPRSVMGPDGRRGGDGCL